MKKAKTTYQENRRLTVRHHRLSSDDYLEYKAEILIKDSGKNPIQMKLDFDGILPFSGSMPPKKHIIKAESVLELYRKANRWLKKYGYEMI